MVPRVFVDAVTGISVAQAPYILGDQTRVSENGLNSEGT